MKFYGISPSTEIDEIGFYPQARIANGYNPTLGNSYLNVEPYIFPDYIPNYELTLAEQAIPTDIIDRSSLTFGMVVSKRLKNILKEMQLPPHRFYPVKVHYKNDQLIYFWFHFIADLWRYIDLEQSQITIFNVRTNDVIEEFAVKSREIVKQKKRSLHYNISMRFKAIYLKREFPKYDIFELTDVQYGNIISNSLKNTFENEGATGYRLTEYDRIVML